jgi:hypothetical protein
VLTIARAWRLRLPGWPLRLVAALIPALFTVDWVYWLYHSAMGNRMLRWENFKVSMAIYFLCGIFWCYPGSVRDFLAALPTRRADQKQGRVRRRR